MPSMSEPAKQVIKESFGRVPLEMGLGWRYFRSRRQNSFVSFIAQVSLFGILLGIAALIVVVSVMNGFGNDLRERILGSSTHVIVTSKFIGADKSAVLGKSLSREKPREKQLVKSELVKILDMESDAYDIAPYAKGFGMLANKEHLSGVNLHGVEPLDEDAVTQLSSRMLVGRADNLQVASDKILLGDALALELGVHLNDEVTLILPQSQAQSPDLTPKLRRYRVGGIFHFDHPDINLRDVYLHRVDLLRLQGLSDTTPGFRLRLTDPFLAPQISKRLRAKLNTSGYAVSDWTEEQASIFKAVKMEKTVMFILLLLIVAVAVFNIVSTLMMVVKDKRHDIAVLRTLGMSPNAVTRIFFTQGMLIGLIGTLLGVLFGVFFTLNINPIMAWLESNFNFSLFPRDLVLIQGLPHDIQVSNIIVTVIVALLLTAMAAIYPARKAALVEPGEALRYD